MTLTPRGAAVTGALLLVGALAVTVGPNRHHPQPHPTGPVTTVTVSQPATTLAYPTRIELPDQLAQAISQTQTNTAAGCPGDTAVAWAEIDAAGTVQGIHAACATGPGK